MPTILMRCFSRILRLRPSPSDLHRVHRAEEKPQNNLQEGLDVYGKSRILTNGSRLSQKPGANQGIHSRVSGGSSA
jgi:hypothetical protein